MSYVVCVLVQKLFLNNSLNNKIIAFYAQKTSKYLQNLKYFKKKIKILTPNIKTIICIYDIWI